MKSKERLISQHYHGNFQLESTAKSVDWIVATLQKMVPPTQEKPPLPPSAEELQQQGTLTAGIGFM